MGRKWAQAYASTGASGSTLSCTAAERPRAHVQTLIVIVILLVSVTLFTRDARVYIIDPLESMYSVLTVGGAACHPNANAWLRKTQTARLVHRTM